MINIKYAQIDPEAKGDISAISVNEQKGWSNVSDLRYDGRKPGNYATLEHNFCILNGEQQEFPNSTAGLDWGWWSASLSNDNGIFASPPKLDITFANNHKSLGITLYFYPFTDDYAKTVRITWYNSAGGVIIAGTYELGSNVGVVRESVVDYRRIVIEMLSTNIRNRYVKLYAIDFGVINQFEDSDIDACGVLEEIDPISDIIAVNTANFTVKVRDPLFSPISGDADDDMVMKKQRFEITANSKLFGVFFLDEWKDIEESGVYFSFKAEDAVAILDKYTFYGGMYSNVLVSTILTQIFDTAFPTRLVNYVLDSALSNARITGWLPICTCREALQQICFAINAVADTSRIENVWIHPRDMDVHFAIPLNDKYKGGGKIGRTPYYSGVNVVSYGYTQGTEVTTVQDGILAVGTHEVAFSEPLHTLTITGGTIVSSNANRAIINVPATGTVVLSGRRYIENKLTHSVSTEVAAGEIESIAEFDQCTLVNSAIGNSLAAKILSYLQNRILMESDILLKDREVGYIAEVATSAHPVIGTIEKLDIDLRAEKARMKVIGNVDTTGYR